MFSGVKRLISPRLVFRAPTQPANFLGPLSSSKLNAIRMAFSLRADSAPLLFHAYRTRHKNELAHFFLLFAAFSSNESSSEPADSPESSLFAYTTYVYRWGLRDMSAWRLEKAFAHTIAISTQIYAGLKLIWSHIICLTSFVLMDYPIHMQTLSMELSIL